MLHCKVITVTVTQHLLLIDARFNNLSRLKSLQTIEKFYCMVEAVWRFCLDNRKWIIHKWRRKQTLRRLSMPPNVSDGMDSTWYKHSHSVYEYVTCLAIRGGWRQMIKQEIRWKATNGYIFNCRLFQRLNSNPNKPQWSKSNLGRIREEWTLTWPVSVNSSDAIKRGNLEVVSVFLFVVDHISGVEDDLCGAWLPVWQYDLEWLFRMPLVDRITAHFVYQTNPRRLLLVYSMHGRL